jgi:glycosyltransferase involved in cell wall biosynthesis
MAERLREYGETVPLHVQPTGIPLDHFGAADGAAFRRQHGIPEGRKVALYVGRVAHEKNIDFLLQVARCCRDNQPDLCWLIAGEGPALNDLKTLAHRLGIESLVRFVGYLDRRQALPACYAAADVFVFASRTETQGLVLLEAMASGCPVVALSCLGTADIVAPRQGAVVPRDDVGDFSRELIELLRDEPRRAETSRAAVRFARRWSDDETARQLGEFYQSVVAQKSGSPVDEPCPNPV